MGFLDRRIPEQIGDYEILERLGGGGMAEVFLGRRIGTGGFEKQVAIKRILPHLAGEQAFVRMLIDEARIASGLSHSNIIQIYELGESEGSPFIVMERVPGKSLMGIHRRLRRLGRRMPPAAAAYVMGAVCAALEYAHTRRGSDGHPLEIIHRDVSPSNVLVSFEGDVKLIDFGIARAAQRLHQTQTGTIKGKYGYMAPEQVLGDPIDHRSDVFSAGVVLYELVAGQNPLQVDNAIEAIERARIGKVAPPSAVEPTVPSALESICLRALAAKPGDRYQHAVELEQALNLYLRDDPFSRLDLAAWLRATFPDDHEVAPAPEAADWTVANEGQSAARTIATVPGITLTLPLPAGSDAGADPTQAGETGPTRVADPVTAQFDREIEETQVAAAGDAATLELAATTVTVPLSDNMASITASTRRARRTLLLYLASGALLLALAIMVIALLQHPAPLSSTTAPASRRADVAPDEADDAMVSVHVPDLAPDTLTPDLTSPPDLRAPRKRVKRAPPTTGGQPLRHRRVIPAPPAPPLPGHGWLTVVTLHGTDDIWAHVLVDGRLVGTSILYRVRLPAGSHLVVARRDGFQPARRRIFLRRGEEVRLVLKLTK